MARLISRLCGGPVLQQVSGRHQVARSDMKARSAARQNRSSKYGSGPRYCAFPCCVGAVEVDQRGVQPQRRHGDQFLAVGVRRAHRAQLRVHPHHVGAQAGPDRQERQPVRGGQQAQCSMPSSSSVSSMVAFCLACRKCGSRAIESSETKPHDHPADPARGQQQPDVRAAVGDDVRSVTAGAQDRPHQRHRLAPATPAADPDRHPGAQLAGHVVRAQHRRSAVTVSPPRRAVHEPLARLRRPRRSG